MVNNIEDYKLWTDNCNRVRVIPFNVCVGLHDLINDIHVIRPRSEVGTYVINYNYDQVWITFTKMHKKYTVDFVNSTPPELLSRNCSM